jgi:RecA/RadA recombinase
MGEHAAFIAHLLDPQEAKLIGQARQMQAAFLTPMGRGGGRDQPVMQKAQQILQFKRTGEQGIRSGAVKSIIPPAHAAHVRREAERFIDELRRAA